MAPTRDKISLSPEEDRFCNLLDDCAARLRTERPDQANLELRVAGGWVRDKLLGTRSNDLDVAVSSMTGQAFAKSFVDYLGALPPGEAQGLELGRVATIEARPDQSKHLETATTRLLGLDLDFVQLRSEEYSEGSRIPEKVEFGTPLQDAMRRDITINALFYNVHTRSVEDQTGKGLDDLREGRIRTPLPSAQTFTDDPLRLLRCVRFASRFGFDFDDEIVEAAKDRTIRTALMQKISRERVGIEVDKMLKGPDPVWSLRLIDSLDLYPLIFVPPPSMVAPLPTSPSPSAKSLRAALLLSDILSPPSRSSLPQLLPAWAEALAKVPSQIKKRLYLACALSAYRGLDAKVGKRTVWAGEPVVSEGLKLGNHDRDYVSKLFAAADILKNPTLDRFKEPSERVALGLTLRNSSVHDLKLGLSLGEATRWETSVLHALVQELVDLDAEDAEGTRQVVELYNGFVGRLYELDIPACLTPEFDKARLDGKEICGALSIKPSKALAGIIAKVVERQLENPNESKEAAKEWLVGQVAVGSIKTS